LTFCGPIIFSQLCFQGTARLFLVGMSYWHGLAAAGHWGVATRISESVVGAATQAVYNVALVYLARLQNARDRVSIALEKAQSLSTIAYVPMLAALSAAAEPLVQLLLGPSWTPTAILLQGPIFATFLLVRRMLPLTALRAIGCSHVTTTVALADGITAGAGLLFFGRSSPLALAIMYGLSVLPGYAVIIVASAREFDRPIQHDVFALIRDLFCGLLAVVLAHVVSSLNAVPSLLIHTMLSAGVASFTAFTMLVLTQPRLVGFLFNRNLGDKKV
jgi:O-antigen/teichoic acid export membrane protein